MKKVIFDKRFVASRADAGAGLTSPLVKRIEKIKWRKKNFKRY
jgi:hypothetical protein